MVERLGTTVSSLQINQLVDLAVDNGAIVRLHHSRIEDSEGERIVVALPVESPELRDALPGDAVGVVSRGEKGILILRTLVIGQSMSPLPLLTLRVTGESEHIQRRKDVRLRYRSDALDVRLVEDGQNKLERVSILNISAGGLLIRSTQPLAVGSHLQMRLLLPGVLPHLDTDGEVMWLTPSKDCAGRGYRLGVRFANLSQHEKDRIVKFIFGEQIKGKATQGRWGTQLAVR